MKRRIAGLRVLITGASSGIGRALAAELAHRGASVLVSARREERLRILADDIAKGGGRIEFVAGDLTDEGVRNRLVETAKDHFGGLDVLVNNAGVGAMGKFEHSDPRRIREVMELNFFTLLDMTRLALPLLRHGTTPMIVNVSSILGLRGTPYGGGYSASKFAVEGFSQSLRAELTPYNIDVLVVSPGTTRTEFFDSVLEKKGEPAWPSHAPVSAEYVAAATVRAMEKGKHAIIPYFWGKVLVWLNRLSPRLVDGLMSRYV
jgi:short-subunit dehydrogenase